MHFDMHFDQWNQGKYTVEDRRIMLTQWVRQAWKKFHEESFDVIRRAFRKLGLSLTIDGSEDDELHVKDLSGIEVGDWRRNNEKDERIDDEADDGADDGANDGADDETDERINEGINEEINEGINKEINEGMIEGMIEGNIRRKYEYVLNDEMKSNNGDDGDDSDNSEMNKE